MMNDTANIPTGKVTAHIVADFIQLPKQNTQCCDFHYVDNRCFSNCSSTAVPDAVLAPASPQSCVALPSCIPAGRPTRSNSATAPHVE